MRILLVNYECPPVGGGGGISAFKLARSWVQQGAKVDYLTSKYKDQSAQETRAGVRIIRTPVYKRKSLAVASIPSMLSYPPSGLITGMKLLFKHSYDLLNTHFAIPSGPLGWSLSRLGSIPNVLSVHGGDIYDPTKSYSPHKHRLLGTVVNFMLNQANAKVAQSSDTRDNIQNFYNTDREIRIIPLPYSPPEPYPTATRNELNLNKNKFYLISVGRLIRRKGYDRLIDSLENLPKMIELILIGKGPLKEQLKTRAAKRGVNSRIRFTGFVEEELKYKLLNAADLYVLPSRHEGFGIVLQEAMAAGLPIVATRTGGQTDLIEPEKNGLLVDSGSPKELTEPIMRLHENQELREQMSHNNLKKVETYRPKKVGRKYLNLFQEVAKRHEQ